MTDGADVLQLERNLKAMGFAPKGMNVDRDWDAQDDPRGQALAEVDRPDARRHARRLGHRVPARARSASPDVAATLGTPRRAGHARARRDERRAGRDAGPLGEPPGPGRRPGQAVTVELPDETLRRRHGPRGRAVSRPSTQDGSRPPSR